MSELKFATRLNSFASGAHLYWPEQKGKPSVLQMIERAATVKGLTHLDLNYPQHITDDIHCDAPKNRRSWAGGERHANALGCARI